MNKASQSVDARFPDSDNGPLHLGAQVIQDLDQERTADDLVGLSCDHHTDGHPPLRGSR
jgi:hypothetical protein